MTIRRTPATGHLPPGSGTPRFPTFDVMAQAPHWDAATRAVVDGRLDDLPPVRFFTPAEEAAATCLLDQLMGQRSAPGEERVELVRMVDGRLAEDQTDGWHYDDMPTDEDAWRRSLAALDEDAGAVHGRLFVELSWDDQHALLTAIKRGSDVYWHGLPRTRLWGMWTRYASTAFYSHPWAWNEIGFSGPAYPRGYKNAGIGRLESFEVHDAQPSDDPLHRKDSRGEPESGASDGRHR